MIKKLTQQLIFPVSLMFTAALTLSGCANTTAGVGASSSGQTRIDSNSLSRDVKIEQIISRRLGDLLQGTAVLVSQGAYDVQLQYKFTWFDLDGISVDDEGNSWKSLTLHGHENKHIQALAPNPMASSFEIYVRKSHSN
ncbi:YcfL family protein [Shewanella sp. SR44-3]|uniref:YcfL family protein n=1 Tax=unclassified Shewanella TaxID=196818 RepID=UPI0015FA7C1F|nr:YcfL family protein [Shewanella sp. SR44-3]MBB1269428.1 YcfL family protein [Shewanella sp. SR44-3]